MQHLDWLADLCNILQICFSCNGGEMKRASVSAIIDLRISNDLLEYRVGEISIPGEGSARTYLKALPPAQLVNEVAGYLAANALGLPIPKSYLAECPLEISTARPITAGTAKTADGKKYLLFATAHRARNVAKELLKEPPPSTGRSIPLDEEPPRISDLLRKWGLLSDAACFNQWVANDNTDRFNLLIDTEDRFLLKDHDAILFNGTPSSCGTGSSACRLASHAKSILGAQSIDDRARDMSKAVAEAGRVAGIIEDLRSLVAHCLPGYLDEIDRFLKRRGAALCTVMRGVR
jgi:hypothetical protein